MRRLPWVNVLAVMGLVFLLTPVPVAAYVGPGVALAAIGAAIAFVGGIAMAVGGFVWYPLKRILRLGKKKDDAETELS